MNRGLIRRLTCCLCILMLAFASGARSQEQTGPPPQTGAKVAKGQPEEEEPEAKPARVQKLYRKRHRTLSRASLACRCRTTIILELIPAIGHKMF